MGVHLSVVLPAFNEAENLAVVVPRTISTLDNISDTFEVLVIDDGSTDDTRGTMKALLRLHPHLRYVRLRRNYGKSAALQIGLDRAEGEVIALMDADGQDEPQELARALDALNGGLDLVTGRRSDRKDRFVKRITSRLYNRITALVTGVPGRDFNSGLKVMRKDAAETLEIYGELHRYIPVLAHWAGFRVGEIDVVHNPRLHGSSKFGKARFWRGFLDLITVKFITTYTARPFHLFGGAGILLGVIGGGLLGWMAVLKIAGYGVGHRPALLLGILLVVVAVQLLSLGLIGELLVYLRRGRTRDVVADES